MSKLINEAVRFLSIPPHSLHISMELSGEKHSRITEVPHKPSDLVCLMMLGGDLRRDEEGKLREWRIFNKELDTNMRDSLNFSDRKYHYSRPDQSEDEASDVMEYKFLRLRQEETDYSNIIIALKGYQFGTHARPISIPKQGQKELPEQIFLREWAASPQALSIPEIQSFVDTVERGLCEEHNVTSVNKRGQTYLENIYFTLLERNAYVAKNSR